MDTTSLGNDDQKNLVYRFKINQILFPVKAAPWLIISVVGEIRILEPFLCPFLEVQDLIFGEMVLVVANLKRENHYLLFTNHLIRLHCRELPGILQAFAEMIW